MNNDPVRELVGKALRRVRNIADEPGTSMDHGVQFGGGMRRAANMIEADISKGLEAALAQRGEAVA